LRFAATMRKAPSQGTNGGGWGQRLPGRAWGIDLTEIRCPVLLWYGNDNRFAPQAHGLWLVGNVPHAARDARR
jgi:pimeloyl-ACP methyl ester carboxylesterase